MVDKNPCAVITGADLILCEPNRQQLSHRTDRALIVRHKNQLLIEHYPPCTCATYRVNWCPWDNMLLSGVSDRRKPFSTMHPRQELANQRLLPLASVGVTWRLSASSPLVFVQVTHVAKISTQ